MCTAALMFNFLDRGILSLLVTPIKTDLALSDVEIGLLMGFAFVAFYAIVGLPIARLVDSYSRRLILGAGIAMWSGATALCGLAHSFWQLFLARLGVGVGEACNGPATFSLLADLFPPARLPRAFSILNVGFMLGTGLALIVGGSVIEWLSSMPAVQLPGLGALRPWQLTFFAVGVPGLVIAALMSTVREPVRRVSPLDTGSGALPLRAVFACLRGQRAAYGPMFLGLALQGTCVTGIVTWVPTFFIREHGWSIGQVGLCYGAILLLVSPFGLLLGSWLAERYARIGCHDGNLRVVVLATAASLPFMLAFPLVGEPWLAIVLLAGQNLMLSMAPGPQNAALQLITPNRMRGQVTALFLFMFNLLGFGLGPVLIALLSERLFGGEQHLGQAFVAATLLMEPLALLVFWRGLAPYGALMARSAQAP